MIVPKLKRTISLVKNSNTHTYFANLSKLLYFSELKNKRVLSENGVYVGKLQDFVFRASSEPQITKLVVQDKNLNTVFIPVSCMKKINSKITLCGDYENTTIEDNELYVVKNLLDKQIIDIKGNKIVRVNDVIIQDRPPLYVLGVDIGWLGILRWLKLEKTVVQGLKFLGIKESSKILSWNNIQPLELARGKVKLNREERKLDKVRPEDLADYLQKTTIVNVSKFLKILDEKFAAEVVGNLNLNYQAGLFRYYSPEKAAKMISLIDSDEAVDILLTCSLKKREQIINLLNQDKRKEINYLLNLSKTPIGQLITSEVIKVSPEDTAAQVIKIIKTKAMDFTFLNYVYVVNKDDQLVGVFDLHELLMQSQDAPVFKFMVQNVVVIHLTTPEEIVVKKMAKYKVHALPVTDDKKRILGLVTFDSIADFVLNNM